jgi:hypothetical protein
MIFGNACPKGTASAKTWAGAVLGTIAAGKYPLADANVTGGLKPGRFVAGSSADADGEVELAPMAVVNGYSGGTPGNYVYVDPANDGRLIDTVPAGAGNSKKRVGIVLAADTVLLAPCLFDLDDPTV